MYYIRLIGPFPQLDLRLFLAQRQRSIELDFRLFPVAHNCYYPAINDLFRSKQFKQSSKQHTQPVYSYSGTRTGTISGNNYHGRVHTYSRLLFLVSRRCW